MSAPRRRPAPPRRLHPVLAVLLAAVAGLFFAGTVGSSWAAGTAGKRPIAETDLFRFVWVADPQISPDGQRVAFVRVTVDAKKEGYETALWVVAADGSAPPRPLTAGPADRSPRWSPSSRQLAFVRSPAGAAAGAIGAIGTDPGAPQIYLLDMAGGGEARAVTDLPGGAEAPAWSPDGARIAFASSTSAKDLAKKAAKTAKAGPTAGPPAGSSAAEPERESDVRVITRDTYRQNGGGYRDLLHPDHLWLLTVPAADASGSSGTSGIPEPLQLTRGDLDDSAPLWAPDGKSVWFLHESDPEPYYKPAHSELYAVPAAGGAPVKIVDFDGGIASVQPSLDGRRIALTGVLNAKPERSYGQPDLFVADLPAAGAASAPLKAPRNLTAGYDFDVDDGLSGDQHAPRGSQPTGPVWSRDGASLFVVAAERGRANLQRFDVATGQATPLTRGDQEVVSYTATPDGGRFAVVLSTPTAIGDLWALDIGEGAAGRLLQLTRFNDPLMAEIELTPPVEVVYKSFDGREIQAWVQRPPGFDPAKKYPLILDIHGGPHSAYGWTFDHEFQWLAAQGYLVLYPNPRGSTSYGQEFGNIIQYHYPGDDYRDLMVGVDEVIRRGWADPARLGVTGGSGGGILTNWIVTQTGRFKAAAAQRSIADWAGFWYTADFTLYTPRWFHGAPWEDPEDFRARSPITYVAKITTPLMLIEGEADLRTPPGAGGEQMFRALKYLHKPVVMVRFPGESHELSRSGKPWHRVERLRHLAGWFDKYLLGKNPDAYNTP